MHRPLAAAWICSTLLAGPAAADYFAEPRVTATDVHDDNLFFAPVDPEPDRIYRLSPALEAGYRSEPLNWSGLVTVDAERYDRHSELDSNSAREHAALGYAFRRTREQTLFADASWTQTELPGELAPETGLELGRGTAERFALAPSLVQQFDRRTLGFAHYGFTRDVVEGLPDSATHALGLGFSRRSSRRDTASLEYRSRQMSAQNEVHGSHAVLAGLAHRFTERTTASVLAGPLLAGSKVDLEAAASLRRELQRGELSLDYARTETTVVGLAEPATTQSLGASADSFLGPLLEWRIAASLLTTEGGGQRVEARVFDLYLGSRLTRLLTLYGAYAYRAQRGRLDVGDSASVSRNVFMLGLVIRAPERDEREQREAARRSRARHPSLQDRPWDDAPAAADDEEEEP